MSAPLDTSADAHAVQIRVLRSMTDERRAELAFEMTDELRQLVRDGVAADLVDGTSAERHTEFLRRWLGDDLFRKVRTDRGGSA